MKWKRGTPTVGSSCGAWIMLRSLSQKLTLLSSGQDANVCLVKKNLGDSIVLDCIDCHKVAWVVCHECRPDSSIDRPWQLGARKSKHTRCYDCYDKSLADKHDATFKKKQRDIVIEGRRLRREHELERRRRLQLMR